MTETGQNCPVNILAIRSKKAVKQPHNQQTATPSHKMSRLLWKKILIFEQTLLSDIVWDEGEEEEKVKKTEIFIYSCFIYIKIADNLNWI